MRTQRVRCCLSSTREAVFVLFNPATESGLSVVSTCDVVLLELGGGRVSLHFVVGI